MAHTPEIVIVGAGAIGGLTSAYLARAEVPLTVVDPWFRNVETLRRRGIEVNRLDDHFTAHPRTLHIDELSRLDRPIDILILALKSYDTEWAARLMTPYLANDAVVISAQNGMNEGQVAAVVGKERVIGCVVAMSGFLEDAGRVMGTTRLTNEAFILGELDGTHSYRAAALAELLAPIGRITLTDRIKPALWAKLLLNVMLNSLAGLTGWNTPATWSDDRMIRMMVHLGGEACLVAAARGEEIDDLTPPGMPAGMSISPEHLKRAHGGDAAALQDVTRCFNAMAVGRSGGEEGIASLLQDLIRGRRTEVDYLNGYILRLGAAVDVDTPANAAITRLIHAAELVGPPPERHDVDEIVRSVGVTEAVAG